MYNCRYDFTHRPVDNSFLAVLETGQVATGVESSTVDWCSPVISYSRFHDGVLIRSFLPGKTGGLL